YVREDDSEKLQIIINLSSKPVTFSLDEIEGKDVLTTHTDGAPWNHKMVFAPYEGRIRELSKH
ncbi:MAG: hypothetical protein Q8N92_07880, partial [Erysipelotrichaceae bacterium]|nr:hypothetical protein [Erysipelotrichaceae bacterium]